MHFVERIDQVDQGEFGLVGALSAYSKAMVTLFLSVFGAFLVGGVVFVSKQVANAVEGYEDETGFHYKTPQKHGISHPHSSQSDAEWHRIARPSKVAMNSAPVSAPSR